MVFICQLLVSQGLMNIKNLIRQRAFFHHPPAPLLN